LFSKKCRGVRRKFQLGRKLENVLPAPENKNREKRVWAIAQDYSYGVTFKVQCPRFLSRRLTKKRGAEAPPKPLPPNL